jgi:molecular chaperone GrpE
MGSGETDQPQAGILPEACASSAASGSASDEGERDRLCGELAALQDRHLRLQAEFDNYRKRQQREREELNRQAKERILGELPAVVDNLERALRHAGAAGAAPETLAQGVELVGKQLQEVLTRFGVEPIAAIGSKFDPRLHEAMARIETAGDPPDGTVTEEYRRGYLLDGKVLRPALVAVAKLSEGEGETSS